MKNKKQPETDPVVVDKAILETAKAALRSDHAGPVARHKCTICGSESAPNSNERLCWVCRRLKISAWRDSDQQMSAQE
jgi:hypothetical protein